MRLRFSHANNKKEDAVTPQPPGELYTESLLNSPPVRFAQNLGIWNGRLSSNNWFALAFNPLGLLKFPPLLWSAVVYALSLGWLAVLAETFAHLFQFSSSRNHPWERCGRKISDILASVKAYRNKGVYEPVSLFLMMLPAVFATTLGLAGYGWRIPARTRWIVPTICSGAIYFGCILGTTAVAYCLDCHKANAIGTQVVLSLAKITQGFVFSLFVVDWVKTRGPRSTFLILAKIHLAFLAAKILMYIYGT
ncbi:hypothetical protein BDW66DRAFT_155952 [Aspergillus desertorum]